MLTCSYTPYRTFEEQMRFEREENERLSRKHFWELHALFGKSSSHGKWEDDYFLGLKFNGPLSFRGVEEFVVVGGSKTYLVKGDKMAKSPWSYYETIEALLTGETKTKNCDWVDFDPIKIIELATGCPCPDEFK